MRCKKRGCPISCGSYRKPSCLDRLMFYAVALLLLSVITVSVTAGIRSLWNSATVSIPVAETAPIASGHLLQLTSQTQSHGFLGSIGDADREAQLGAQATVEIS